MVLWQNWGVIVFVSGWLQHKDPGRKHLRLGAMILFVTVRISYYTCPRFLSSQRMWMGGIPLGAGIGIG
jgi:hypothetical protein